MAAPNLTELLLEASRAEHRERWHQESCRARADGRSCLACQQYEQEWLAADLAVHEFQVQAAYAEAS